MPPLTLRYVRQRMSPRNPQHISPTGHQESTAVLHRRAQPFVIRRLRKNHHHPLFIGRLVELVHEGVTVGIDGEHRVAVYPLALR